MKKKDILFLCQFTFPEYISSAVLPFDTAKYLAANGFSVTILGGYPKEYSKAKSVPYREMVEGVDIRRIRYIQMNRSKRLGRLINYFSFTLSSLFRLAMVRKYRSVIVYSNPPILPLVAALGNILFGTKIVFVVYDVYPEIAYASKSIKPGNAIDYVMRWINKVLYQRVFRVVALTDEMKSLLLKKRSITDTSKIQTIPNWASENVQKANDVMFGRLGYTRDKFIISYLGNMGICQDMETLLGAVLLLKEHPTVRFLIAGHGSKMEYIREMIEEKKLTNVRLFDFLSGRDFEQAIAVSSCCVVSLERNLKGTSAPSKYYRAPLKTSNFL